MAMLWRLCALLQSVGSSAAVDPLPTLPPLGSFTFEASHLKNSQLAHRKLQGNRQRTYIEPITLSTPASDVDQHDLQTPSHALQQISTLQTKVEVQEAKLDFVKSSGRNDWIPTWEGSDSNAKPRSNFELAEPHHSTTSLPTPAPDLAPAPTPTGSTAAGTRATATEAALCQGKGVTRGKYKGEDCSVAHKRVEKNLGAAVADKWCRDMSGCEVLGSKPEKTRTPKAFYYVDQRVSSLRMRLKQPTWDRKKATTTAPYDYDVTSPADYGLPSTSQLRFYAASSLGLKIVKNAPKRPSFPQFLEGLVQEAKQHRPDFIFTDMPDLHQCIDVSGNTNTLRSLTRKVADWATRMAQINTTVIYTPFPLQDERRKLGKYKGQNRDWSIKMIDTIADEIQNIRREEGTPLQMLEVSSSSDWKGNGKARNQMWDGTHMVYEAKKQVAKIVLAAAGRMRSRRIWSDTCSSNTTRLRANIMSNESAQRKRVVLRSKNPTQRWHGFNDPKSCCEDHEFLDCRLCCPNSARCNYVGTDTTDGVILQSAVDNEYDTGRALDSRLNNSEWDISAQHAVEILACARIWFVGDSILRNTFFATTNLLKESFSEGAYMTPRSMYFKWSYTTISVLTS